MTLAASKQVRQYRQYEKLWLSIASLEAAERGVVVSCHKNAATRIVQAVRKEKTLANSMRKALSLPCYGKLLSTVDALPNNRARIHFTLVYNGDLL